MPRGSPALASQPPDPRRYRTWQEYGEALGAYQDQQRLIALSNQPEAVLLVNIPTELGTPPRPNPGGLARALADGMLVFDPTLKRVRLAYERTWYSLAIEGGGP